MTLLRLVAAVCALGSVAGCSGGGNSGGDTTCRAFDRMSDREKDATVIRVLQERGDFDPSEALASLTVSVTRTGIGVKCFATDDKKTRIGDLVD